MAKALTAANAINSNDLLQVLVAATSAARASGLKVLLAISRIRFPDEAERRRRTDSEQVRNDVLRSGMDVHKYSVCH